MEWLNVSLFIWMGIALFLVGLGIFFLIRFLTRDTALTGIEKALQAKHYKKALNLAQKFSLQHPDNYLLKYYMAQAYEGLGEYARAVEYYEKASVAASVTGASQDTIAMQMYLKIAELYNKIKRKKEALGYYVMVLDKNPNNSKALYAAAEILYETKNYRKAREYLEILVKMKADHFRGRFLLAKVYLQSSMVSEALSQLETITKNYKVSQDSFIQSVRFLQAECYSRLKNYQKAIDTYRLLLDAPEYFEDALVKMVDNYVKFNRLKEAEEIISRYGNRLSKIHLADALYLVAAQYFKGDEIYQALRLWERISKTIPAYKDVKNLLDTYQVLIKYPQLETYFSKKEAMLESYLQRVIKARFVKQTVKQEAYWVMDTGDTLHVFFRKPLPITEKDIGEIEETIERQFPGSSSYNLYSIFGLHSSLSPSRYQKMLYIEPNKFLRMIEEA
ncbi:MAG: tetratricopeptide repeat protein [Brevinematales bacterium]|nr:tetratricopeptide repeat protein [Brevinematales bacterium]